MFHFLHLQENLVYISCQKPIVPNLIYHVMGSDSVYIRSIYQLDSNTLLVDLNVPTGELDFNLTTSLIGVCNKYFYTYQEETYILEASLASRGSQNYSRLFLLFGGRIYARRKSIIWLSTFIQLLLYGSFVKFVLHSSTVVRR